MKTWALWASIGSLTGMMSAFGAEDEALSFIAGSGANAEGQVRGRLWPGDEAS